MKNFSNYETECEKEHSIKNTTQSNSFKCIYLILMKKEEKINRNKLQERDENLQIQTKKTKKFFFFHNFINKTYSFFLK